MIPPFRAQLLATRCARRDGYLEFQRRPEPMLEWFATPAAFEDKRCSACPCPASNAVPHHGGCVWWTPRRGVGEFDHLAFAAGDAFTPRPLADIGISDAHAILAVRFWGAVAVINEAPSRIRPGGSIGLTTGTVGQRAVPGAALAAAGAGAAEGLVRGLAVELAPVRSTRLGPALFARRFGTASPRPSARRFLPAWPRAP